MKTKNIDILQQENRLLHDSVKKYEALLHEKEWELEIEAALERVRARSMAMRKSDELMDAGELVYRELSKLGIENMTAGYVLINKTETIGWNYGVNPKDGSISSDPTGIPLTDSSVMKTIFNSWKLQEPVLVIELDAEKTIAHQTYIAENATNFPLSKEELLKISPERLVIHTFNFNNGYLLIVGGKVLTNEQKMMVIRFAKVFEQTYTRFLDLQKAEAQARESSIQLALERVRARTMAMQHSEELQEASQMLDEQVRSLGIETWGCAFHIYNQDDSDSLVWDEEWFSSQSGILTPYKTPRENIFKKYYDISKTGKKLYVQEIGHEKIQDHYKYLQSLPVIGPALKNAFDSGVPVPYQQFDHCAYFKQGHLLFITYKQVPEAHDIFKRFARVFEQTYTRFLDLKKAETQAREALIEASLERVRAKTMAMHHTSELQDVINTVHQQLTGLNIAITGGAFIAINDEIKDELACWGAGGTANYIERVHIPFIDSPIYTGLVNGIKEGPGFFTETFSPQEKVEFFKLLFKNPPYNETSPQRKKEILSRRGGYTRSCYVSKNTSIFMIDHYGEKFSEQDNDILKRFGIVFEQTYTRFLDLQKAEAQAREAQIEAALERVRSRTMGMQKSEELAEVSSLMFQQLKFLKIDTYSSGFTIWDEKNNELISWMCNADGSMNPPFHMPLAENTWHKDQFDAWQNGKKFLVKDFQGEEMKSQFRYLRSFPLLDEAFKKSIAAGHPMPERQVHHIANFSHGNLLFITLESRPEAHEIFKRFAKVFEQTYTRFLDLKKAEAQAKEAQIEASLERIRARSLGMHESTELHQVVDLLYKEIKTVIPDFNTVNIQLNQSPSRDLVAWLGVENSIYPDMLYWPDTNIPFFSEIFKAWTSKSGFVNMHFNRKEKNDFFKELYPYLPVPPERKVMIKTLKGMLLMGWFNTYSAVYLLRYSLEPFTEEEKQIVKRFSSVFEQTYTRFLDLQKAEAQARESEIQLALERVRARTMAMHKSEELAEVSAVLFQQLNVLGNTPERINIGIVKEDKGIIEYWATDQGGNQIDHSFNASIEEPTTIAKVYTGWKNHKRSMVVDLQGDELNAWMLYLRKELNMPFKEELVHKRRVHTVAYFSQGMLLISTPEPVKQETITLLERFASVFNLTYRRFLDLKKAEAQARESQIEASLEKVRGKAMAMHTSKDLSETASMVFTELRKLGVNPIRSGVGLFNKESRRVQLYSAISSDSGDSLSLVGWVQLENHPVLEKIYETWLQQEDYFPELQGEQLKKYYQLLLTGLSVPIPDFKKNQKQFGHFIHTSIGCLYAWSDVHFNEEQLKIFRRFTSIVDLTFRRYFELQQSEASAKEAIKQAALDRIRADIASMRTVSDLERITPLIWNELTALGIPFIRCGVFIMDNEKEVIQTYLSTPEGKSITSFDLPFETPGKPSLILKNWEAGKRYIDAWSESDFSEFAQNLVKEGVIQSAAEYLNTLPQNGFYLHFLHFLQGMLYVANTTRLAEDELNLIQAVADSFSTAYARYEDFKKLEEAKQQVEHTLTDLRQTQQQLVQSEKMASLGELTAGIAHEIKNPLNFVNNFSEVSKELLEEMNTELKNGNYELVAEIAGDVNQNLEKILHHGKRADGIVKGMLQHSRSNSGQKEEISVNSFVDEYLRLAYHGLRAKDKSFNAKMETDFDTNSGKIMAVPQELGRVILNLLTNAFYAVNDKKKKEGEEYEPTVWIKTHRKKSSVEIKVVDNGGGIPEKIRDKIFQPFFTTKPTGEGTGLGLSLSYDIVKAHGGDLTVDSDDGKGTTFILTLKTS